MRQAKHSSQFNSRILAMGLIGIGLVLLGIVAALALPKGTQSSRNPAQVVPAKVDFLAPELSLNDLQGNPVSLANFQGQVVLVNNWATWCPPCKEEMPTLLAYYEKHHEKNFTIVAIEAGEPLAEVADFAKEYGLTFPVWPDTHQKAMTAFKNEDLPSTYVIDRGGRVRLAWVGAIGRDMLEKFVTPLLEE